MGVLHPPSSWLSSTPSVTNLLMGCMVDLDFHHSLAIISDLFFASSLAIWVRVVLSGSRSDG